jgi:hypothetical protein
MFVVCPKTRPRQTKAGSLVHLIRSGAHYCINLPSIFNSGELEQLI